MYDFKIRIRKQFEQTDLAYVFDISTLIGEQQNQVIKIFDENSNEVSKREMNQKGTFERKILFLTKLWKKSYIMKHLHL